MSCKCTPHRLCMHVIGNWTDNWLIFPHLSSSMWRHPIAFEPLTERGRRNWTLSSLMLCLVEREDFESGDFSLNQILSHRWNAFHILIADMTRASESLGSSNLDLRYVVQENTFNPACFSFGGEFVSKGTSSHSKVSVSAHKPHVQVARSLLLTETFRWVRRNWSWCRAIKTLGTMNYISSWAVCVGPDDASQWQSF